MSIFAILFGECDCEDCEQMRAVSRPRGAASPVERLVDAIRDRAVPHVIDVIRGLAIGGAIAGAGYGLIYGALYAAVHLSPGASTAVPHAACHNQTASAEAVAGPTYQAVR